MCAQTCVLPRGTLGTTHNLPVCEHSRACGCAATRRVTKGWAAAVPGLGSLWMHMTVGVLESAWPEVFYFGRRV